MKSFFQWMFGTEKRLSALETFILNQVQAQLEPGNVRLWELQVAAINKVQRLPSGIEVDFYRMKSGRPSFDSALAFSNKQELLVATTQVGVRGTALSLKAQLTCINGFIFSIRYSGEVDYFEEALGVDPPLEFEIYCSILNDLSKESSPS